MDTQGPSPRLGWGCGKVRPHLSPLCPSSTHPSPIATPPPTLYTLPPVAALVSTYTGGYFLEPYKSGHSIFPFKFQELQLIGMFSLTFPVHLKRGGGGVPQMVFACAPPSSCPVLLRLGCPPNPHTPLPICPCTPLPLSGCAMFATHSKWG